MPVMHSEKIANRPPKKTTPKTVSVSVFGAVGHDLVESNQRVLAHVPAGQIVSGAIHEELTQRSHGPSSFTAAKAYPIFLFYVMVFIYGYYMVNINVYYMANIWLRYA